MSTLQRRSQWLRGASSRALRHALRPFTDAGWTLEDMFWALDHRPDGSTYWQTSNVHCPVGWLHARLRGWQGLPAPVSAARATAEAALRAEQLQRQAERAAAEAAAVPMPPSVRDAWRARRRVSS